MQSEARRGEARERIASHPADGEAYRIPRSSASTTTTTTRATAATAQARALPASSSARNPVWNSRGSATTTNTATASSSSHTPSLTVPCELQQIQAHAAAITVRVKYLQGLIGPSVQALDEVREIKRVMKDTHRMLEGMQTRTKEMEEQLGIGDVTVQAWQAYQSLVRMEGRLRGFAGGERRTESLEMGESRRGRSDERQKSTDAGKGSKVETRGISEVETRRVGRAERVDSRKPSTTKKSAPVAYVPSGAQKRMSERVRTPSAHTRAFEELDDYDDDDEGGEVYLTPGVGSRGSPLEASSERAGEEEVDGESYMMSGALSHSDAVLEVVQSGVTVTEIREESSGELAGSTAAASGAHLDLDLDLDGGGADSNIEGDSPNCELGRRIAGRRRKKPSFSGHLAKSRFDVERECEEEERIDVLTLNDGDRQREGSLPGYYVSMFMACGIKDTAVVLPKLRFIKVHEVRELRNWLSSKGYVRRKGDMSRLEKVLCLLLLLQEGCRYETLAVLFSRTPREVQNACRQVMKGLLELHSETILPRRQPTCDRLWGISVVFFNVDDMVARASQYYGWEMVDLIKVLVTLNMFIGRFRQQGRFALSGPYFEWWKCFQHVTLGDIYS